METNPGIAHVLIPESRGCCKNTNVSDGIVSVVGNAKIRRM